MRLLLMDVISRFVGYHKLCLFPFYAFLQSYLTAHQQQVTRILVFLVQSCHDYVPPEELVPLVRVIADNFVSDRAQPEVIALGINTLSEMFLRVPLLFQLEDLEPLIHELVDFRTSRDKGVMVAARNFLNVFVGRHSHRRTRDASTRCVCGRRTAARTARRRRGRWRTARSMCGTRWRAWRRWARRSSAERCRWRRRTGRRTGRRSGSG